MQNVKEIVLPQFMIKNIDLNIKIELKKNIGMHLYTDEQRLKQILINFISNSLKFTQKGGVSITVQEGFSDQVVKFSVSDTGAGMDKYTQSQLFKAYNTFHNTEGTGLGLYIAEQLINLIGIKNRISVDSKIGKGTTFTFFIYRNYDQRHINGLSMSYIPIKSRAIELQ